MQARPFAPSSYRVLFWAANPSDKSPEIQRVDGPEWTSLDCGLVRKRNQNAASIYCCRVVISRKGEIVLTNVPTTAFPSPYSPMLISKAPGARVLDREAADHFSR